MKRRATKSPAARRKQEVTLERELSEVEGFDAGRRLQARILDLGNRMRELREDVLNLSQTRAAKLIGMEQSELSRIENGVGNRGPSCGTITRIIEAYQACLQNRDPAWHLGLNIQLRRGDTEEVEQRFLAGSG